MNAPDTLFLDDLRQSIEPVFHLPEEGEENGVTKIPH